MGSAEDSCAVMFKQLKELKQFKQLKASKAKCAEQNLPNLMWFRACVGMLMLLHVYFQGSHGLRGKTSYFSAAYTLYLYFISLTLAKRLYSVAIW